MSMRIYSPQTGMAWLAIIYSVGRYDDAISWATVATRQLTSLLPIAS